MRGYEFNRSLIDYCEGLMPTKFPLQIACRGNGLQGNVYTGCLLAKRSKRFRIHIAIAGDMQWNCPLASFSANGNYTWQCISTLLPWYAKDQSADY